MRHLLKALAAQKKWIKITGSNQQMSSSLPKQARVAIIGGGIIGYNHITPNIELCLQYGQPHLQLTIHRE